MSEIIVAIIPLAIGSGVLVGLGYLVRPRSRLVVYGALAGTLIALVGIGMARGGEGGRTAAAIIAGAVASFGGAFFAFVLAQSGQQSLEAKRFRVEALEDLDRLFRDPEGFGREDYRQFLEGARPWQELYRLARRAQDKELITAAFLFAEDVRSLEKMAGFTWEVHPEIIQASLNDQISQVYSVYRSIKTRVERLLLTSFSDTDSIWTVARRHLGLPLIDPSQPSATMRPEDSSRSS